MPIDNANMFHSMNTDINPTEYIVPVTQVRISRVVSVYSSTSGLNRMTKSSWKLRTPPLPLPPRLPTPSHRPKRPRMTHPSFPFRSHRLRQTSSAPQPPPPTWQLRPLKWTKMIRLLSPSLSGQFHRSSPVLQLQSSIPWPRRHILSQLLQVP